MMISRRFAREAVKTSQNMSTGRTICVGQCRLSCYSGGGEIDDGDDVMMVMVMMTTIDDNDDDAGGDGVTGDPTDNAWWMRNFVHATAKVKLSSVGRLSEKCLSSKAYRRA